MKIETTIIFSQPTLMRTYVILPKRVTWRRIVKFAISASLLNAVFA